MDTCNCKNLITKEIITYTGPNSKNRTIDATCVIRKDPTKMRFTNNINEKYYELTGKEVGGIPSCVFFNNSNIACTECPCYEKDT